jgi:sialidase-1
MLRKSALLLFVWNLLVGPVGATQVDVFVAGESTYYCIKIPTLVVTSKNSLIAMGEARSKGGNSCSDFTGTDLVTKRSTDGGLTWSPLRVVHSENSTVIGNVAPVQLKSGRILFPFCKNNR